MDLLNLIESGILLWDGDLSTVLPENELGQDRPIEKLCLEAPELVRMTHVKFAEAGAMGITTNTSRANRVSLSKFTLEDATREINLKGAKIARDVAKRGVFVAGSVGPTGKYLRPLGDMDFTEAVCVFEEQIEALVLGGVETILIEKMVDVREMKAAIIASKRVSNLPVIAMMTFQENMKTLFGTGPAPFGVIAGGVGADLLGLEYGGSRKGMAELISLLTSVTEKPVIVRMGARNLTIGQGQPAHIEGTREYSQKAKDCIFPGVRIIGGGTGTNPEHVRETRTILGYRTQVGIETISAPPRIRLLQGVIRVASRSRVECIDLDGPLKVVGERINPTGKPKFIKELKKGTMDHVVKEAKTQEKMGAHLLDVNASAPGLDEGFAMEESVISVNTSSSLPIMIDSSNTDVIRRGLCAVDGLPIINSVSGLRRKLETILPLAREFGSPLICLPFDEKGIPETPEGRLKAARRILLEAEKAGVTRDKLIVDSLATAVSHSRFASLCALETVKLIKRELGLPVIMGVSNVSYGMPMRGLINRAFLAMSIAQGLDLAMIDPCDESMSEFLLCGNLLTGKDINGKKFIRHFNGDN